MKKDLNRTGATLCSSMRPRSATTSWLNKFKLLAFAFMALLSINQVWGAIDANSTWTATALGDIPEGSTVIICSSNGKAINNADATSGGPTKIAMTFTSSTKKISVTTAGKSLDDIVWTTSKTTNGTRFWQYGSTTKLLGLNGTSSNTAVRVTTSTSASYNEFVMGSNGKLLKYYNASRYIGEYVSGSDFRSYNSETAANYSSSSLIFYVMDGGSTKTDYYFRGEHNSWGATKMTAHESGYYAYYGPVSGNQRFKIAKSESGWDYTHDKLSGGFQYTNITNMGHWDGDGNCGIYDDNNYYILIYYPNTDVNSDATNPKICASSELPNYAKSGNTVYFDNSLYGSSTPYLRMGRNNHSSNNAMTKVTGTASLYKFTTTGTTNFYENYSAYTVANAQGSSSNIYDLGSVTKTTVHAKKDINKDITIVPTGGDTYYNYNESDGMLTHNVSIGSHTNGTIKYSYTDVNGTAHNDQTTGASNLAHTCNLTITATPNTGYQLTSLTVNDNAFTSGNVHILSADATIEATFSAASYSVTLNTNGGTIKSGDVTSYTYGVGATLPTQVEKSGYTFGGWFDNSDCTGTAVTNIATNATGDKQFWAKWIQNVTVTFKNNGETTGAPAAIQLAPGSTLGSNLPGVGSMTAPISGYTFIGWVNHNDAWGGFEAEMTQALITGNEVINADVTYDAVWAKVTNNYEVVREAAGLTAGNYVIDGYDDGDDTEEAMDNTFNGKTFPTEDHGVISTTDNSIIWNVTIKNGQYALKNLSTNTYFNFTSSSSLTLSSTPVYLTISGEVEEEDNIYKIDLNNGSRHLEYDFGVFDSYTKAYNSIYFYKQKINNYFVTPPAQVTVTWHIGNGTQTATTYDGTAFTELTAPEVDDDAIGACVNKFMGWATTTITKDEATAEDVDWADETTISNSNKDFYAVFANAEGSGDYTLVSGASQLGEGEAYIGSYINYSGWNYYVATGAGDITKTTLSENVLTPTEAMLKLTLVSTGTANQYYLKDASGKYLHASGTGVNPTLSETACAWTFSGESSLMGMKSSLGSNVYLCAYSSGTTGKLKTYSTESGNAKICVYLSSVTYSNYATSCPELKYATIHFDANGKTLASGSMPADITNAVVGRATTLPGCSATVTGYTFAGWSETSTGSVITEYTPADEDQTYIMYAKWTPKTVTITWNANGGSVTPASSSYTYDGASVELPTPTTTLDKKFVGWFTAATGGTQITEIGTTNKPAANVTYHAQWRDIVWTDYLTDCGTPYNITLVDDGTKTGGNTFSTSPAGSAIGGSTVTLTANPNGCYTFTSWSVYKTGDQSTTVDVDGNTFEMPEYDVTVDATFTQIDYVISYDLQGGAAPQGSEETYGNVNVGCGNTWTAPVDPVKSGYTFQGWLGEESATLYKNGDHFTPTKAQTMVAQWTAQTYTITYLDRNGATFSGTNYDALPKTHTYGEDTNIPDATVDDDHVFQGWWWDAACTDNQFTGGVLTGTAVTTNVTLYAKILPKACSDQYSFHWGGSDVKENNSFLCFSWIEGTKHEIADYVIENAADVHKYFVGYNGYFYNDNLGTKGAKSYANDVKYIPFEATMTNDARPTIGSNATGAIGTLRIYHDSEWDNLYLTFRPNGYGLMYGATGTENKVAFTQTSTPTVWRTAPVELTADMKKTDGSFKYQVGLLKSDDDYTACGHGEAAKFGDMRSYCSTWDNGGWGGNLSGYDAGRWGYFEIWIDNVTKNWYCHFTPMYRLHYDLDGGENANIHDEFRSYAQSGADLNTTVTTEVPVRDGYTFLGWKKGADPIAAGATVAINADNVVITAQWAKNYTVTYDLAGYSTSCSSSTVHYCGEEVTVCPAPEDKTGYTFMGWNTDDITGSPADYTPGETFVMPCERVVDVVFTADYQAVSYTITYEGLEGATHSNPTSYTIVTPTITFTNPTARAGYEFLGWFDAETDGNKVTGIVSGSTGDVTVWAHWNALQYTVRLDKNDGDADGTATFVYNTSNGMNYTAVTRNGYDLNGYWTTAGGGTQVLDNSGTVTAGSLTGWKTDGKWTKANNDGVLYAHWTAKSGISYTVNHYQMNVDGETYTLKEHIDGTGKTGDDKSSYAQPKTYEGFATPEAQTLILTWPGPCVVNYYYERNKYELTWNFDGGTPTEDYTQGQVYHGATITYPTSVSKDGYCFKEWVPKPTTMPMAATTITAQWAAYTNYRTYCGDAVTFYAQNGTVPEEEYVIITDNNKITTPTLVETGFTQPEGWVLLGWTKVGGDPKDIVAPNTTKVDAADGDEYNAVWTHITITGNVLTTSAVGVQVGTTIHVEGTTNNAYGLRVSFVDTKGTDDPSDDVTYQGTTGETSVAKSDFRLANTSYTYIDGSIIQIEGTAAGDTHSSDYNVVYTPLTANEIDNYVLQIQVMQTSKTALDGALYTLNLKGRALPDNFVIAEYQNDKWYALPADMNGSNTYAGKEITVEGSGMDRVAKNATLDMVYSMKTYNFDRSHVLFQSQFNQGHLWAATGNETGINDYAKTVTGEKPAYSWMPTPQDEALDTYVMSNVNNTKTLVLNSSNTFGMYAKASTNTDIVYFIPLKAEEYVEKEMMMVEWFPTKVLVEVDEDALMGARAKINNVEVADVTASDTKYGTHLYEITGLNTLVDNAANKLTILYTKEETTYGHEFDIPVIMSNKTYSISGGTTFPWTQAVYNTADLVVRDGSVLTVNGGTDAANTFGNVTIYPTSKVVVPAQTAGDNATDITMTTTTMTLFGGTDEIYDGSEYTLTKYGVPQLVLNGKLVHNETTSGLVYDVRLDAAQYYNFALPYTSKYELVTDNKGGEDFTFWTKVYDGATRAAGNNGWVWYNWNADPWAINIGTGYMFAAQPNDGQNYIIIRHPMGYSTTGDKYAQNEGGHQSGTAEATKAAVNVYAYPSKYDNNAGWNYIANPFMANFTKDLGDGCTGTIQTGQLVEHKVNEKRDGHYEWEAGSLSVRYVTLYDNGTDTYEQLPMSTAVLAPFTGFFVQMAETGQIVFDISGRTNEAPARMLSEDELPSEMEIFLHATCQGQKDDAVLFINDNLHRDNAKEFPNEMTKQENANTLNFYTFGGDDIKMYANGMSYEDAQGWSKAGVKVATAGEYTFSVASDQADYIQQVILRDMDSNTEYDLMNNDAKIYMDKGEMNDRFYVKIVFGKHNIGTDVTERYDTSGPEKFILNDHMYIRANGVLFDGVGKRVKY